MIGRKMVRSAGLCSAQSEGIKKIGIGGNRLIIAWNRRMNRRLLHVTTAQSGIIITFSRWSWVELGVAEPVIGNQ